MVMAKDNEWEYSKCWKGSGVFIVLLWTKLVLFYLQQGLNFCMEADGIQIPELGLGRNGNVFQCGKI